MSEELPNEWGTDELEWVKLCQHSQLKTGVEYNFMQINLIHNLIIS